MAKENKCSNVPSCVKCNQKHPTCLHNDTSDSAQRTDEAEEHTDNAAANCIGVCSIEGQQLGEDQSLIIPVWVSSSNHPQNESLAYALIDCQSNATFITEKLRQTLNVDGVDSHLLLSTMHKENEIVECKNVKGLIATDLKRQINIPLPKVYTRQTIPYKASQIPKPEVAMQWNHLNCIAEELMPY